MENPVLPAGNVASELPVTESRAGEKGFVNDVTENPDFEVPLLRILEAEQRAEDLIRAAQLEAVDIVREAREKVVSHRQQVLEETRTEAETVCTAVTKETDREITRIERETDQAIIDLKQRASRNEAKTITLLLQVLEK